MDPTTSLGLSSDCIASYCIGDVIRAHSLEVPELLPCGYLVGDNNVITVNLKGKCQEYFCRYCKVPHCSPSTLHIFVLTPDLSVFCLQFKDFIT